MFYDKKRKEKKRKEKKRKEKKRKEKKRQGIWTHKNTTKQENLFSSVSIADIACSTGIVITRMED